MTQTIHGLTIALPKKHPTFPKQPEIDTPQPEGNPMQAMAEAYGYTLEELTSLLENSDTNFSVVKQDKGKPSLIIDHGTPQYDTMRKDMIFAGTIGEKKAENLKIVSYDEDAGGVLAKGRGSYSINNLAISKEGKEGGTDAERAAIGVTDYAQLEIHHADIACCGNKLMCSKADNHGILKVYDSHYTCMGAPYGDGVEDGLDDAPNDLGVHGNTRTHFASMNSASYFYNCSFLANGWGIFSCEFGGRNTILEADNCRLITTRGGYGAAVDGYCHVTLSNCFIDVADMGVFTCYDDGDITFKDCDMHCGKNAALLLGAFGTAYGASALKIIGSTVTSKDDTVRLESEDSTVILDHSTITSDTGILIHSVVSKNIFIPKTDGLDVYGIRVYLKNGCYSGDILHEDSKRDMHVFIDGNTVYEGMIESAILHMEEGSLWKAQRDSHITSADEIPLSSLDAEEGVTIYAKANENITCTLPSGGVLKTFTE